MFPAERHGFGHTQHSSNYWLPFTELVHWSGCILPYFGVI